METWQVAATRASNYPKNITVVGVKHHRPAKLLINASETKTTVGLIDPKHAIQQFDIFQIDQNAIYWQRSKNGNKIPL